MSEDATAVYPAALSTRVEEEFVSPLTAVRGALEILRDFPDLAAEERRQFVDTALRGCARLERGVEALAASVYQAAKTAEPVVEARPGDVYESRIRFDPARDIVEVDFSDIVLANSNVVDAFYDVIDRRIEASGRRWYVLVNYRNCAVWPEAWVASAHRAKKLNTAYSLGTVRYLAPGPSDERRGSGDANPDLCDSREAALARIEALKRAARCGATPKP